MTTRSVAQLVHATPQLEGEGMLVTRPFPTARLDHLDPFLLLDRMGPAASTLSRPSWTGPSSTRTRRGTAAASARVTCSG
jgi:redox-sensitive bicupin YhaK (pirin superfamily)